jgi:transposase
MSNTSENNPSKTELLREEGTLNPAPEKVLDAKFRDNEFFDPRDLVQVKYEMLRRVSIENAAVIEVVQAFGVSRPTYYHARASLDQAGIAGLVPKKRGPRGPHKMHGKALAFVKRQLVSGQPLRARQLARLLQQKFRLTVHPRTIERAVRGKKTAR